MCRVSTLVDPPQVVPFTLKFPQGFESYEHTGLDHYCSDSNCQKVYLLPVDVSIAQDLPTAPRPRPETLSLNLPTTSEYGTSLDDTARIAFECVEDVLSSSEEPSPSQSPKPKKAKKSVRFADDCGKDLEHFCYIPSRRAHARKLFTVMLTLEKLNDTVEETTKFLNSDALVQCVPTMEMDCDVEEVKKAEEQTIVKVETTQKPEVSSQKVSWKPDFELPADSSKKMFEKLGKNVVTLSSFSVQEEPLKLAGNIWVMNFGDNKNVFVRCSTDNWDTSFDVPATFLEASDHLYDVFAFDFKVPENSQKISQVSFCLCYKVNESIFWDKNEGQNYTVTFHPAPAPTPKAQLTKREAFVNRRQGKAEAQRRHSEVDWSKFEKLEAKTDVKFIL